MKCTVASILLCSALCPSFGFGFGLPGASIVPKKTTPSPSLLYTQQDAFDSDEFPSDGEVVSDEESEIHPILGPIVISPEALRLKQELLSLAATTKRGFTAQKEQRQRATDIINNLVDCNPTREPASAYYPDGHHSCSPGEPTVSGKWTLVYTDAPDITTLDGGPLATAKLGRIGQECEPPFIKNIIEWRRPNWASNLPFSGTDESRVLQKVCLQAFASPEKPSTLNLKLMGLDLSGMSGSGGSSTPSTVGIDSGAFGTVQENIQRDGIIAGLLESNGPLELRGPLSGKITFGQCDVLYLDDEMRIIKTGQNFFAVNVRDEEEWF